MMKYGNVLLILVAAMLAFRLAAEETKVIAYNVLIGFNRATRIDETARWIKEENPDVVLFQEIARQDSESFGRLSRLWGHGYGAVAKPWQDYSIGLSSKKPYDFLEIRTEGMHHGYVLAKIDGVYYMSIHYSPFKYKVRIRESEIYAKRLKPLIDAGEKVIVMGDFNNPSPYDAARANANAPALEVRRYETRSHIENIRDGFFDFQCMTNLLDIGLEEVCFFWMKQNNYDPGTGLRIDMAFISKNLEPKVTGAFQDTRKREFFNTLSDHYPVILTLKELHQ